VVRGTAHVRAEFASGQSRELRAEPAAVWLDEILDDVVRVTLHSRTPPMSAIDLPLVTGVFLAGRIDIASSVPAAAAPLRPPATPAPAAVIAPAAPGPSAPRAQFDRPTAAPSQQVSSQRSASAAESPAEPHASERQREDPAPPTAAAGARKYDHLFGATSDPDQLQQEPEQPRPAAPPAAVQPEEQPRAAAPPPVSEPEPHRGDRIASFPSSRVGHLIEELPWRLPSGPPLPAPAQSSPPPSSPAPSPPTPAPPHQPEAAQSLPTPAPPQQPQAVPSSRPEPAEPEATAHLQVDGPYDEPDVAVTVYRSSLGVLAGPMVQAVRCASGHLNAPYAETCRVCTMPIAPQVPFDAPRPALGVLELSTGDAITLDRAVIMGRSPRPLDGDAVDRPNLIRLAGENFSRNHVAIALDGWHVLIRDLGSTNGTVVSGPNGTPERLRPQEERLLEPGSVVSLAAQVSFRFSVPD
jgi:hypothetical protein